MQPIFTSQKGDVIFCVFVCLSYKVYLFFFIIIIFYLFFIYLFFFFWRNFTFYVSCCNAENYENQLIVKFHQSLKNIYI